MNRQTHKRRLERAGYVFYSGWLPDKNPQGPKFAEQVEFFLEDVEKAVKTEPPRGRPPKPHNPQE